MCEPDAERILAYIIEAWPEPPLTAEQRASYLANLRGLPYVITCRRAVESLRFRTKDRPTPLDIYNATAEQEELSAHRGERHARDIPAWQADMPALPDDEHEARAERIRRITDRYLALVGLPIDRRPGQPREETA